MSALSGGAEKLSVCWQRDKAFPASLEAHGGIKCEGANDFQECNVKAFERTQLTSKSEEQSSKS
jgi:hypothetical protein